jgi:hypothetical protein
VHRIGEKAENQRKTRKKSKVAEKKCFGWIFCTKRSVQCAYTLRRKRKGRIVSVREKESVRNFVRGT